MKSIEERKALLSSALSFIGRYDHLSVKPRTTLCAPRADLTQYGFRRVSWAPYVWISDNILPKEHIVFTSGEAFSIGLSSVYACLQLNVAPGHKILDMCAAPGIKSAYLQIITGNEADIYVNDISAARLGRLRRLHELLHLPIPTITKMPGERLYTTYSNGMFDRILIDAPCSGEGNILAGDSATLQTWSPAKVKRLHILQQKLIKTGLKLVGDGGVIVYSTCTLNKTENEKSVKNFVGSSKNITLSLENIHALKNGEAVRLLPSENSIGFFVARLQSSTIEPDYE